MPVLIQSFIGMLMFMSDTAMLGRLGENSKFALTAMGIVGPIMWLLEVLSMALGTGALSLVARKTGGNEKDESRIFGALAIRISLLAGCVIGLTFSLGARVIVRFFTDDSVVIETTTPYIQVLAGGIVSLFVVQAASGTLYGAGDTLRPMIAGIISNIVNIVSNYLLIFGKFGFPRLEVRGAALATTISFTLYAVIVVSFCFRKRGTIGIRFKDQRLSTSSHFRNLMRVVLPATVQPLIFNTGYVFFSRIVMAYGITIMAAHRVAIAVESLSFIPGGAFAVATASLFGKYLGAQDETNAKKVAQEAFVINAIVMSFASLILALFPSVLSRIFTDDSAIIELSSIALRIWAFEQLPLAFTMTFEGVFRGAGATEFPLISGAIGVWLARILPSYIFLSGKMAVQFIWMTTILDWLTQACILYIFYKTGCWRRVKA